MSHSFDQATIDNEYQSIWRRLRRNVSIGVLGSVVTIAIKLTQAVVLTRFLPIDDYGRLLIVLNLFVFLDSFVGLRVSDVMFRFFQPLRERDERQALRSLLLVCLAICLASGLLIYLGVLLLSPFLSAHLYSSPGLATLFKIYGFTVIVSSFAGVYEPLLRIYDRFSAVVVPQILGSLATLIILIAHFVTKVGTGSDLRIIVAAFAIGVLVQNVPPLWKALRLVRPFIGHKETKQAGLRKYRGELIRCLFNSNLSGYLKFAINPGDIFLLGLFSSPTQVALYGLARQLTSPLAILQTTIQTAITPEVTSIAAKLRFRQLQRLISNYVVSAFLLGGVLLVGAILLGHVLILNLLSTEYVPALPVFYCLAASAWLLLVFVVFRPLALSLDLLKWHNLALMVATGFVLGLIVAGRLNAQTLAAVQIADAMILRLAFSLLVWNKLRQMSPAA